MILLAISRETDKNNTLLCNIKSYSETSTAALEILDIDKTEIKESNRLQRNTSKGRSMGLADMRKEAVLEHSTKWVNTKTELLLLIIYRPSVQENLG
jgi:hypothetical protein